MDVEPVKPPEVFTPLIRIYKDHRTDHWQPGPPATLWTFGTEKEFSLIFQKSDNIKSFLFSLKSGVTISCSENLRCQVKIAYSPAGDVALQLHCTLPCLKCVGPFYSGTGVFSSDWKI